MGGDWGMDSTGSNDWTQYKPIQLLGDLVLGFVSKLITSIILRLH